MDLTGEGILQLARDIEAVEDRLPFAVELHLVGERLEILEIMSRIWS